MRLVVHLGRAALIFWVAAVVLPAAVQQAETVPPHPTSESALHGMASTSGAGRDLVADITARVHGSENGVRSVVARWRLETERFIAKIP